MIESRKKIPFFQRVLAAIDLGTRVVTVPAVATGAVAGHELVRHLTDNIPAAEAQGNCVVSVRVDGDRSSRIEFVSATNPSVRLVKQLDTTAAWPFRLPTVTADTAINGYPASSWIVGPEGDVAPRSLVYYTCNTGVDNPNIQPMQRKTTPPASTPQGMGLIDLLNGAPTPISTPKPQSQWGVKDMIATPTSTQQPLEAAVPNATPTLSAAEVKAPTNAQKNCVVSVKMEGDSSIKSRIEFVSATNPSVRQVEPVQERTFTLPPVTSDSTINGQLASTWSVGQEGTSLGRRSFYYLCNTGINNPHIQRIETWDPDPATRAFKNLVRWGIEESNKAKTIFEDNLPDLDFIKPTSNPPRPTPAEKLVDYIRENTPSFKDIVPYTILGGAVAGSIWLFTKREEITAWNRNRIRTANRKRWIEPTQPKGRIVQQERRTLGVESPPQQHPGYRSNAPGVQHERRRASVVESPSKRYPKKQPEAPVVQPEERVVLPVEAPPARITKYAPRTRGMTEDDILDLILDDNGKIRFPKGTEGPIDEVDSQTWAAIARGERVPRLLVDQFIDQYAIKELLGTGSFSSVYRVDDRQLRAERAMKILRPELYANANLVNQFAYEARVLNALDHPNIVKLYDAQTGFSLTDISAYKYIVTEYVDGKPLHAIFGRQNRRAAAVHALDILAQTAAAIRYAHGQGIIHSDLHPDNIMLRKDGQVKVIDFGSAHNPLWTELSNRHNATAQTYTAPEVLRGEKPSEKSDIYSLAVVAFELLTGRFPSESTQRNRQALESALKDTPPGIFASSEDIIRALSSDKTQRPDALLK
jgi:tRNA A-37 threonylcarbamoyl transferase component Bud32